MRKVKLLNILLNNASKKELLEQIQEGIVFTPNVDHIIKLQKDKEFFNAYSMADYKLCDSQILVYASRFLGEPVKEKVSGSDFFPAFYNYHKHNQDIKIFLMGADKGVALKAQKNINKKVKRNMIVSSHSPVFGFESSEEECLRIIDLINESGATVLAIGVGAPKQEKWIYKYKHKMPNIKIFMAIGATIDFEAGNVKRAPKWMSKIGLEWLHRLVSEPKRLWKRYLIEDLPFFWLVLKQKFNLYKPPTSQELVPALEEVPVQHESFDLIKSPMLHQSPETIPDVKRSGLDNSIVWLKPTSSMNLIGINSQSAKSRQKRKARPKKASF